VQDRILGRPRLRVIQGGLGEPTQPPPASTTVSHGAAAGALGTALLLGLSGPLGGSPLERLLAGAGQLSVAGRVLAWATELVLGTVLGALFGLTLRQGQRWSEHPWRIPWALAYGLLVWTPLQVLAMVRAEAEGLTGGPPFGAGNWAPFLAYGMVLALTLRPRKEPGPGPVRRAAPRLMALPGQRREPGQRRPWRLHSRPPARPKLV
jgi:hypothetical protein